MLKSNKTLKLTSLAVMVALLVTMVLPVSADARNNGKDTNEIKKVTKAVQQYFHKTGSLPTLQGEEASLNQAQPVAGSPHNLSFQKLSKYLKDSVNPSGYWWVDEKGSVYHTDYAFGIMVGSVFCPSRHLTFERYSSSHVYLGLLSGSIDLSGGDYLIPTDEQGNTYPMINVLFRGPMQHPESPEYRIDDSTEYIREDWVRDASWTILSPDNAGTYLNETMAVLIAQGKRKFYLRNGLYLLNNDIKLTASDIIFTGESKENTILRQTNIFAPSLVMRSVGNIAISNLTVDNRTIGGDNTIAAADVNHISVDNCILYQDDKHFAVYFSGKDYANDDATNAAVENGDLDYSNSFTNNWIESTYWGDCVVFALQKDGLVSGNTLVGSRLVLYLCNHCDMTNNTIKDTVNHGIAISTPLVNCRITHNTIDNTVSSGIVVKNNLEHPIPVTYRGTGNVIADNTISRSGFMGIEACNLADSVISGNTIRDCDIDGIYLLYADRMTVVGNNITNCGRSVLTGDYHGWSSGLTTGIFLDFQVKDSLIDGNTVANPDNGCIAAIRIMNGNENTGNTLSNNRVDPANFMYTYLYPTEDSTVVDNYPAPPYF